MQYKAVEVFLIREHLIAAAPYCDNECGLIARLNIRAASGVIDELVAHTRSGCPGFDEYLKKISGVTNGVKKRVDKELPAAAQAYQDMLGTEIPFQPVLFPADVGKRPWPMRELSSDPVTRTPKGMPTVDEWLDVVGAVGVVG